MEATVTIICGMILALGQGWLNLRLRQQDDARDAAREEAKTARDLAQAQIELTAQKVKEEAKRVAAEVADKVEEVALNVAKRVDDSSAGTDKKLNDIHILVNGRLSEALARVEVLEAKLAESSE